MRETWKRGPFITILDFLNMAKNPNPMFKKVMDKNNEGGHFHFKIPTKDTT